MEGHRPPGPNGSGGLVEKADTGASPRPKAVDRHRGIGIGIGIGLGLGLGLGLGDRKIGRSGSVAGGIRMIGIHRSRTVDHHPSIRIFPIASSDLDPPIAIDRSPSLDLHLPIDPRGSTTRETQIGRTCC
jgi:hypothetical protein